MELPYIIKNDFKISIFLITFKNHYFLKINLKEILHFKCDLLILFILNKKNFEKYNQASTKMLNGLTV